MKTAAFTFILSFLLCPTSPAQTSVQTTATFEFRGRAVTYETFATNETQTIVLLHGASGLDVPLYRQQAKFFSNHGYRVLLLHYFDATASRQASDINYATWADLTSDFVQQVARPSANRKVFIVGYSLGASVALAAGSQGLPVTAIAEWYGSLPDAFFYQFKSMPPLLILHGERDTNIPVSNAKQLLQLCSMKELTCENHLFPDQQHGFSQNALDDADRRTLAFFAKQAET